MLQRRYRIFERGRGRHGFPHEAFARRGGRTFGCRQHVAPGPELHIMHCADSAIDFPGERSLQLVAVCGERGLQLTPVIGKCYFQLAAVRSDDLIDHAYQPGSQFRADTLAHGGQIPFLS